ERGFLLHAWRGLAYRYVRPEAETRRAGWKTFRRVLSGGREEGDQPQVGEESLAIRETWPIRNLCERTVSSHRDLCRRYHGDPVHGFGFSIAPPRESINAYGTQCGRIPKPRLLG